MPARDSRRDIRADAGFSLGDVVRVFSRRRWWLLVPSLIGVVVAATVAWTLPPVYSSSTTILIEPPGIPDQLVPTTVVQDKEARFHNIRLRILSRDNLSGVIDDLGLFPGSEGTPREELVAKMRDQITIAPILPEVIDPRQRLEINSLRISYRSDDPIKAADVANRLARDFIRQNLSERAADAEGTSEFIEAELRRQEERLEQLTQDIRDFKEQNLGSLPEQLETSRRTLERLYLEMNEKKTELEFARNQVNMIRTQLQELRVVGAKAEDNPLDRKAELEMQLAAARANGMTDRHPTIKAIKRSIAQIDALIQAKREAQEAESEEEQPLTSPVAYRLQEELRLYEVQLNVKAQEIERLGEEIGKYEARIESTPRVAARLGALEEQRVTVTHAIDTLQAKAQAAEIARSMEVKQKGEKFRVIESAEPPEAPESPNRPLIFVIGAILGFFSGISLVVVRELSDRRIHTLDDLSEALQLPVLAAVPRIRLPAEIAEARARLRRWGLASAVGAMLLIGGAAAVYLVLNGASTFLSAPGAAAPSAEAAADNDV